MDEVFIKINDKRQYFSHAANQDGDAIDILVQSWRGKWIALRFFDKMLNRQGIPRKIVTEKLRSDGTARKLVMFGHASPGCDATHRAEGSSF